MHKRSYGFLIAAAAFAVLMGYYLLRNWHWVTHSVAVIGYIVLLLLLVLLGLGFRMQENRKNDSDEAAKSLSRASAWFSGALILAVLNGYVMLMHRAYHDNTSALTACAVIIALFPLCGVIALIRERRQQRNY